MSILAFGATIAAAAVGIRGHISAKKKNQQAQEIANEAQYIYDQAKDSLEQKKKYTEERLNKLGNVEKNIIDTSYEKFYQAYKHVKVGIIKRKHLGLNGLEMFRFDEQDALQIQAVSDNYNTLTSQGAAGAATGIVVLAASGSLPVISGGVAAAGTFLAAGQIGTAASVFGSTLAAPLAVVAAPVVLFTGIGASLKADENIDKAKTMLAQSKSAVSQMKSLEMECGFIAQNADMFNELLVKLNALFSKCTDLLYDTVRQRTNGFTKTVNISNFSEQERCLFAVSRALAGAIKAIVTVPILSSEGTVAPEAQQKYNEVSQSLPALEKNVEIATSSNYSARSTSSKVVYSKKSSTAAADDSGSGAARSVIAVILGCVMAFITLKFISQSYEVALMTSTSAALLIMPHKQKSHAFEILKKMFSYAFAIGSTVFFYTNCEIIVSMKHYIIVSIVVAVLSVIVFLFGDEKKKNNFKRLLERTATCAFFFCIAILLYALVHKLFRIPQLICSIVLTVLYGIFALASVFSVDN